MPLHVGPHTTQARSQQVRPDFQYVIILVIIGNTCLKPAFLIQISISSLRNLDIEANKFYDRAH